jgi:DNA helicase HerA-like ATPase
MTLDASAPIVPNETSLEGSVPHPPGCPRFGRLISVSGSQAVAELDICSETRAPDVKRIAIGTLVKIITPMSSVTGIVSGLHSRAAAGQGKDSEIRQVELSLIGEIIADQRIGSPYFRRGVSNSPALGDVVAHVTHEELVCVYSQPNVPTVDVGTLFQDAAVPARFIFDELFGKHFLVVGTTGSGKSCAVIAILQSALTELHHAHIVVLDIHNEYAKVFGSRAELIHPSNLRLPFWLLNFQEICTALTATDHHHDAEVQILSDAIIAAKRRNVLGQVAQTRTASDAIPLKRRIDRAGTINVDTPSPYLLSDVIAHIEEQLGKLERLQATIPYLRLKSRIEGLVADPRYGFMFRSVTVEDTMADVLARIFRVPADKKPITVIDLAAVPSEILDVVVSLIARLAFDLAVWSEGRMPVLLVCEEAHRYAPAADGDKFMPTRQALSRIAKEGRKYGISVGLVTQRPSELDTTIISQCSTVIALRLSTERDQQVMRANTHDGALGLLDYLPLLGDREAIVLGQGVPMPMRVRFRDLGQTIVPGTRHNGFWAGWKSANIERRQLDEIVARWRTTGHY